MIRILVVVSACYWAFNQLISYSARNIFSAFRFLGENAIREAFAEISECLCLCVCVFGIQAIVRTLEGQGST